MSDTPSPFGTGGPEDVPWQVLPGDLPTGTHGRAETANEEGSDIRGAEDRIVADEGTEQTHMVVTDDQGNTGGTLHITPNEPVNPAALDAWGDPTADPLLVAPFQAASIVKDRCSFTYQGMVYQNQSGGDLTTGQTFPATTGFTAAPSTPEPITFLSSGVYVVPPGAISLELIVDGGGAGGGPGGQSAGGGNGGGGGGSGLCIEAILAAPAAGTALAVTVAGTASAATRGATSSVVGGGIAVYGPGGGAGAAGATSLATGTNGGIYGLGGNIGSPSIPGCGGNADITGSGNAGGQGVGKGGGGGGAGAGATATVGGQGGSAGTGPFATGSLPTRGTSGAGGGTVGNNAASANGTNGGSAAPNSGAGGGGGGGAANGGTAGTGGSGGSGSVTIRPIF